MLGIQNNSNSSPNNSNRDGWMSINVYVWDQINGMMKAKLDYMEDVTHIEINFK